MNLPNHLSERPFPEWNHLVRGLMEAWEVAALLGKERSLERLIAEDPDGSIVELYGEAGNRSARRAQDLGRRELAGTGGPVAEALQSLDRLEAR